MKTDAAHHRAKAEYSRIKRTARTPEQVEAARAYQRAYAAERYARLRAAKACINCEAPSERVYCETCRPRLPKRNKKSA